MGWREVVEMGERDKVNYLYTKVLWATSFKAGRGLVSTALAFRRQHQKYPIDRVRVNGRFGDSRAGIQVWCSSGFSPPSHVGGHSSLFVTTLGRIQQMTRTAFRCDK